MDVTDPEILKTEKFGSRDYIKKRRVCRKLKFKSGKWTVVNSDLKRKRR